MESFVTDENTGKVSIIKDPNAVLDYTFNWTDWLGLDTIASREIIVDPVWAVTVERIANTSAKVTVFLSGGIAGQTVPVTCRITTALAPTPRIEDRTIYLKIKER